MMSNLTLILHKKRAHLIQQSWQQRQQFAIAIAPLKRPIAVIDSAVCTFKFMHQHPWLMIGAGFVVGHFRFTSIINTYNKFKLLWNSYEKFQSFIKRS
jgi:YqjK-like protein